MLSIAALTLGLWTGGQYVRGWNPERKSYSCDAVIHIKGIAVAAKHVLSARRLSTATWCCEQCRTAALNAYRGRINGEAVLMPRQR